MAVAVAGMWLAPAHGARGGNVQDFDYDPTEGPAGVVVDVSGTCIFFGSPTEEVFVYLARQVDGDETPFDESQTYPVSSTDGTWSGTFEVPFAAPADDYQFDVSCTTQDQVFAPGIQEPFVVTVGPVEPPDGPEEPEPPEGPEPPTEPPAPPTPTAEPVQADPTFTG